jgi:hypothetical protein
VQDRKFLGYSLWLSPTNEVRCTIASTALDVMKDRVRRMTSRKCGRSLEQVCQDLRPYLLGWKAYFRLVELPSVFRGLDSWMRHRLRALQLKHWKNGPTIFRELRARGMSPRDARRVAGNASPGGIARSCSSTSHCQTSSSTSWGFPGLPRDLNPTNRRMRTRLSGGVAGVAGETRRPYADTHD